MERIKINRTASIDVDGDGRAVRCRSRIRNVGKTVARPLRTEGDPPCLTSMRWSGWRKRRHHASDLLLATTMAEDALPTLRHDTFSLPIPMAQAIVSLSPRVPH